MSSINNVRLPGQGVIFKLALTIAILCIIAWKIDTQKIIDTLSEVNLSYVIVCIVVSYLQTFFIAWRWQHINMKIIDDAVILPNFILHWRYLMISLWFNLALPSSVGGDAVRIWALTRTGISISQASNSVILDRVSALLAVAILIGIGIPFIASEVAGYDLVIGMFSLIIMTIIGFFILLFSDKIFNKWRHVKIINLVIELSKQSRIIFKSPIILISAILIHGITAFAFYLISLSFSMNIGFLDVLVIMPSVILLSALPISISGWGVREGSLVIGLGIYGVDVSVALAASVLFGLCSIMVGLFGGYTWLKARKFLPINDISQSE